MGLDRLQMLREERGWKQSDMARRLWVSQSTYSGYETGKIQVPVDTLLKLADIYDVSMDYLLGRTDERILWDYDGTLANTPVKNIAVTRAVLGRLDPALLEPLPEALSSLAAYQAANYRWRNWRELYQHALRVPADRLDEAGALWGPCQLADRTLPPLFDGLLEVLPRLAALAPMGICSQNDSGNIRAALAAHGAADCFAAVVGHADVDFARQKPDPAAFLACLDRLGLREGRFAYIGDHAGDIAFGRNAQAALRAMGRAAEVVCVAAAWGGAPSVDLAAADAVAVRPADLPDLLADL